MSDTKASFRLFHERVTCRSCGHEWLGYLHGFSRGHGVLVRQSEIAFVPDDLVYEFADQIRSLPNDSDAWPRDPADALREHGWCDIEHCPNCGITDFSPQYDQSSMVDVDCIAFGAEDFVLSGIKWSLSASGRAKMDGK